MNSFRNLAIDVLAHQKLLTARENVRKLGRWTSGVKLQAQLRTGRHRYLPGVLSIIVPVYGVERYIDDCLRSLSTQNYRAIEVVVVDDGSPDRSYDIARNWSLRDPRIRIIRQKNSGLSAARNTGARHAHGEFLAFLDSDDFVDRHTYSDALSTLNETESDFVVVPYRREHKGAYPQAAPWVRAAHSFERRAITVEDFPEVLVNAVAWSKIYRHEFWDVCQLSFPVGLLYEDQALSMESFARAKSFDVLSRVSINWRMRDDQSSISQQTTSARNIHHHHLAVRNSLDSLEKFSTSTVKQERLRQILNNNLGEFLPNIRQMDDEAWSEFVLFVRYLIEQVAEPSLWDAVDARKKILLGLVNIENRSLALRYLESQGWQPDHFAGSVVESRVVGEFPLQGELRKYLAEEAFELSSNETALTAVARSLTIKDNENLLLTLIAYINRIRPVETDPLHFELVNTTTGETHYLRGVRTQVQGEVLGHTRRYADMSDALYQLTIPKSKLSAEGEYELQVTATVGAISRTTSLATDWKTVRSPAVELEDERVAVALRRPDGSVYFNVTRPHIVAESISTDGGSAHVTLRSEGELMRLALVREGDRFGLSRSITKVNRVGDLWAATIPTPRSIAKHFGRVTYDLLALDAEGVSHNVFVPLDLFGASTVDAKSRFTWARRLRTHSNKDLRGRTQQEFTSGCLTLVDKSTCLTVMQVKLEGNELVIACRGVDGTPAPAQATAHVGSTAYDLPVTHSAKSITIRMPLESSQWGRPPRPSPSGSYSFHVLGFDGSPLSLDVHDSLATDLPQTLETDILRVRIERQEGARLGIRIEPLLSDSELGGGNRWRMKDWFYTLSPKGPRSVLFRNLYGESANDSALAVHEELQRRGSPLELIWAVKDHSVEVPEGGTAVLENSRAYYEAFGSANYVMVNVHQPDWYIKREGQVLIQTFHGYPFKMNGHKWWQKLGFTAERQESFFKRAAEWDYLVSPARYATPFLKEFYRPGEALQTEILEIGYPRNDVLVGVENEQVRQRARKNLGVRPGQKAVLYAPTFRDYLSSDDMSAAMVEFLDLSKLMRNLGSEYVILLRGHPFNARQGTFADDQIINVTDYPDINDLILASDVGILDYSSLRFDYALTGKPALFYVPDYEQYFKGRDSFVSFDETAPGPIIRTQSALTEAILDSNSTARKFEPKRAEFIRKFMEIEDGHAAERLVDAVFATRGDA